MVGTARHARQQRISDKIRVLRREGQSEEQAVATALHMERAGRLKPHGVYVATPLKRRAR